MTRPKVDPDKRQRTANACDSCKRRKQKCNGLIPCNTCSKRNTSCVYGAFENEGDDVSQSPKRRMIDPPLDAKGSSQQLFVPGGQQVSHWVSKHQDSRPRGSNRLQEARRQSDVSNFKIPPHSNGIFIGGGEELSKKHGLNESEPDTQAKSHCTSLNSHDEEAVTPNPRLSMRMLQDGKGRLLYLGDSATLSFLQLIRMNVENAAGESSFTQDPQRFSIVERKSNLPPNHLHTHLLPERQTANALVESFLRNTNGLIEVFNPEAFLKDVEKCYADPLGVEADWLCLLNLTFAIGLVMATSLPGTEDHSIIESLRSETVDRSEVFYSNAKHLSDPTTGFEDAGFKSIQALALMSVYTLAVSKRNASYAYYGMAVRSAFALGLHREETLSFSLFTDAEQAERRNLWRSLFVLDRFLSTSLGRPTAIRTSDCSGDILGTGAKRSFLQTPFPVGANAGIVAAPGLAAAIRSCHMIGAVLEKIYSQRKISTKSAQIIADECKGWPKVLDPSLQPDLASSENPSQGIAILHVNLLYHHSIVLLTRPFFLFLMTKKHERREPRKGYLQKLTNKYGKFGDQCVVASRLSISLVQRAFEGGYLPRSNPFVMYFLFASAVVVLASEFSDLFKNSGATKCISDAITIMQYSAKTDPQGKRLLFILQAFRDVIVEESAKAAQSLAEKDLLSGVSPPPIIPNRNNSIPSVGATLPTIFVDLPPTSSVVNGSALTDSSHEPGTSRSSRHNSQALDPMLELSRNSISSGSVEESDSMGVEEQLEFEQFFEPPQFWGSDDPGYMPRVASTREGRLTLGLGTAVVGNTNSPSVYTLSNAVFGRI